MLGSLMSTAAGLAARGRLSILIYHQVLERADPMRPDEPTAERFDWQMRLLARHFTPLSLSDALERLRAARLPRNAVCVTFDDGYRNNLTTALPVLQRYAVPATVYVATAFSHGKNMWNDRIYHLFADPERAQLRIGERDLSLSGWMQRIEQANALIGEMKYLPLAERDRRVDDLYALNQVREEQPLMMNPQEIAALSTAGVEIGAHTHNHPILLRLDEAQQREEVASCKASLEDWTGAPVRHLAYPNGKYGVDFDERAMQIARSLGFSSAVSTDWGVSGSHDDPYRLRRFTPWDKSPSRFQARLHLNQIRGGIE